MLDKRTQQALLIRQRRLDKAEFYAKNSPLIDEQHSAILTPSGKGAMTGRLNNALGDDVNRKIVLSWLFAATPLGMSSKLLTDSQWLAIYDWIGFWRDEEGAWHVSSEFEREVLVVLFEALRQRFIMLGGDGALIEQAAGFGMNVTPVEDGK